jgi:hypothetical protein
MNESNRTTPPPSLPALKNQFTFHPWVLFGLFLVSNLLISYFSLAAYLKFWIGGLGLLVPFLVACWDLGKTNLPSEPSAEAPYRDEFLPSGWRKSGLIFLGLAVLLRFWDLTTLSVWPLDDEGLYGYFAQRWMEGSPLQWHYAYNSIPFLPFWGLGLLFKLFGVSLRSFWLYPALLSLASLFVYGWASRHFLSKSFSYLFLLALGLSFWPLYIGRFTLFGSLMFFWEGLSLAVWVCFAKKDRPQSRILWAAVLGLVVGMGFYIFHIWLVVALVLAGAMGLACYAKDRKDFVSFIAFGLTAALAFAPLAWNLWQTMDWTFLHALWAFQSPSAGPSLQNIFSNVAAFFWGPMPFAIFSYNPLWGGFLNPVGSSLAFLGLVELWRFRSGKWVPFFIFCALVLFIPQALSRGEEYMRALQLIPLFLVLIALGARRLFLNTPKKLLAAGALALLGLSLGLDGHHLFGVYHQRWMVPSNTGFQNKSLERQRAFQIFNGIQAQWGPGLILGDLMDDIHDQTLGIAVWEFNALENPKAPAPRVPWAGILCNVHYRDALSRLFPRAQWFALASDVFRENGGLMAGIIPIEAANFPILQRWAKAEKAMHLFAGDVLNTQLSPQTRLLASRLEAYYPLFKGDAFLESCYWEKQAQNAFLSHQTKDMVQPLENAIRLGIPEAHLYNRLGVVFLVEGDFGGAREALEKALKFPDNQTSASFLYTHFLLPHRLLQSPW